MRDYTTDYSDQKKSNIYFGLRENLISFKPFLESLSFEKTMHVVENSTFYNISLTTKGTEKAIRKLNFNVVSTSVKEAIANHKKFHKLLRMITPTTTQETTDGKKVLKEGKSEVYVYFANLISAPGIVHVPPTTYDQLKTVGVLFNTKGLDYAPDLEMGFFDQGGMMFAKVFKISMDLTETNPINRKGSWSQNATGSAARSVLTNTPGSLFGFPTAFKYDKE